MIGSRPRLRDPNKAAHPVNWSEAQRLSPAINPMPATPAELMIDVQTPDGQTFAIDSPELINRLRAGLNQKHELTLLRCDKAITDCRPVSLLAVQTAKKL